MGRGGVEAVRGGGSERWMGRGRDIGDSMQRWNQTLS